MNDANDLASASLTFAQTQLGITEHGGNNRGPEVEHYLAHCNRPPGDPWCASFVSFCVDTAAADLGLTPNFQRSASALGLLHRNPTLVLQDPEDSCVFVIDHGGGLGHAGFVLRVNADGTLSTIEGNTTVAGGARDSIHGDGVFARTRTLAEITGGFLRIV